MMLKGSMDKNMLKLFAISRISCFYASLRIFSDYLGIFEFFFVGQRESMCPFNGFSIVSTPTRVTLFMNYSNRAKYKGRRYFYWFSQSSEDLAFSRKFCRKTTIDVPFEIKSWIEKNSQLEKDMWTLYSNSKTKSLIFDIKSINKIRKLLIDYNYVQSLQVMEILPNLRTRIVQQNLPHDVEQLQRIFIESFCVAILAVFDLSNSPVADNSKIDGRCFLIKSNKREHYATQQLVGVKCKESGKSFKVKNFCQQKTLMINEVVYKRLRLQLSKKTLRFRFKLLQQCNLKTIKKIYKENKIRCVWILKKNVNDPKFFGILTLRDRIFQHIITLGIFPISESQSDALSFGSRPKKSIFQAIAYVFRKFSENEGARKRVPFSTIKVKKEHFDTFAKKKAEFKTFKVALVSSKKQLASDYAYWIYLTRNCKLTPTRYRSQFYYLNVSVVPCFDQASHQAIYDKIPVASKYLFFVKRWFNKSVIGLEVNGALSSKLKSILVVSIGPITRHLICNVFLDGLQDFIKKKLPTRYIRSCQESDYIRFKTRKEPTRSVWSTSLQVFCVRYVDDILILSKCLKRHTKNIQCLLINFLNQRGLTIKNPSVFQGKLFAPGSSIKYLGFTLVYPDLNKFNCNKGKYIQFECRGRPVGVSKVFSRYLRVSPYILVQTRCVKNLKDKLKVQLSVKNSCLDVGRMIDNINIIFKR
jgi:Reverse transcriptase (RNA-dependent DNA polymerase)